VLMKYCADKRNVFMKKFGKCFLLLYREIFL
jgi:hypothetical protein